MTAGKAPRRYALQRPLGRGSGGAVWLAEDRMRGGLVAIKLVPATASPNDRERLAREHAVLTRCQHPHLVRALDLIDMSEVDGAGMPGVAVEGMALVLEHVAGPTLADALPLSREHALAAWAQVAHAVEALHARGIAHRDLKPSNVLLRATPSASVEVHAVLADLGSAAELGAGGQGAGTLDHVAPETLAGAPPRVAADVHGLGCLLFSLLFGKAPWSELPIEASLEARRRGAPQVPGGIETPAGWQRVLSTLMAPEPTLRPASALAAVALVNRELGLRLPDRAGLIAVRPGLAPLIGRNEFLRRAHELLADAAHGPSIVWISGDPGSGRTRLLEEIELLAKLQGRSVHWTQRDHAEADAVMLLDASDLPADAAPRGLHPHHGIWFVATSRDAREPGPRSEPWILGPLTEPDVLNLASALLGLPGIEQGDGAILLAATGGLPARIEQLLVSLVASGSVRVARGELRLDAAALSARGDSASFIAERIAHLSPQASVLLDAAAVIDAPASATLLASMTGTTPDSGMHAAAVAELLELSLLRECREDARSTWWQAPAPVPSVALARLAPARLAMLHLGAARILARELPEDVGAQAGHLSAAGAHERASPLHRQAALRLLASGSPGLAAHHVTLLLASESLTPVERGTALILRARAEAARGEAREAVATVAAALPLLDTDEQRAEALLLAAESASHAGDPAEAEVACRSARRLFRKLGSVRGRAECTNRLGALALQAGDLRRAEAAFRAALGVSRHESDHALEARVLNNLGDVHRRRGHLAEAARCHAKARDLRRALGDARGAAKATNNLGIVEGMAGRVEEAVAAFGEAAAAFAACGDRREEARCLNNRGLSEWRLLHLDAAELDLSRASKLFTELSDAGLGADCDANRALVAFDAGHLDRALELLLHARQLRQDTADVAGAARLAVDAADVRRTLGDFTLALAEHEEAERALASVGDLAGASLASLAGKLDLAAGGTADVGSIIAPESFGAWSGGDRLRWLLDAARVTERTGARAAAVAHAEAALALLDEAGGGWAERIEASVVVSGLVPDAPHSERLRGLLSELPHGACPEPAWQARLRLARGLAARGQHGAAGEQALLARELIRQVAGGLEAERRPSFLQSPARVAADAEIETLVCPPLPAMTTSAAPASGSNLLELVKLLNENLDPGELLPRVVDIAIEMAGAERGLLILFDDGPERVRIARSRDGRDLPRERFQHSQTIVDRVRASGEPVVVDSFSGDAEAPRSASIFELGLGSATCVPLPAPAGVAGGLLGALYVDSPSRRAGFDQRQVDTLRALASHAAIAMVNSQLLARVRAETASLRSEVERLRGSGVDETFGDALGRSPAMREVFALLGRVAPSDASVLIEGESGTGKEVVARAVHARSRRSGGPFVAVDCGSLPESLIESELFGHKRGAFTGADRDRPGLFEQATGGTIFLDEIAGTPAPLQAKLLRVLQEREVRRVGENVARPIDVRVLAASNRELGAEVAKGRFREDLYYRLNVVHIRLPALRERPEDVPLLARHFLQRSAKRDGRDLEGFMPAVLQLLARHTWPGNVRELQNVVERCAVLAAGPLVSIADLPQAIAGRSPQVQADAPAPEATPRAEPSPPPRQQGDLWEALVEHHGDFWVLVRDSYVRRELTRPEIRSVISRGLLRTGGSYRELTSLLGIPKADYKRFMDFLRQNRLKLDFRPFRAARKQVRRA